MIPLRTKYIASATFMVMRKFCSTRMMARPVSCLIVTRRSNTRRIKSGARPSDGSSSSSSRGALIRPRPIASICCSQPLSIQAGELTRPAIFGKQQTEIPDRGEAESKRDRHRREYHCADEKHEEDEQVEVA